MTDWLGLAGLQAAPPMVLASIIGSMVLMVLLGPLVIEARSQAARVRKEMIERHRVKLRTASLRRVRAAPGDTRRSWSARLAGMVALVPNQMRSEKQRLLRAAGYIGPHATIYFWSIKLGFLVAAGLAAAIHFLFLVAPGGMFGRGALLPALLTVAFFLPDIVVGHQRKTRLRRLERSLPDGLDLLVICAEAGLSLDAALKRVADEFVNVVPELSEELLLTSVELNFLPDRRQALANLGNRVELPAFRGVVATLIQTEKYGTPLAQALRTLAAEFREHRLLSAEEKAARLPAILTVPMIVFILPALFIVLAAPAFIQVSKKFFS